jgi:hypothetical protein
VSLAVTDLNLCFRLAGNAALRLAAVADETHRITEFGSGGLVEFHHGSRAPVYHCGAGGVDVGAGGEYLIAVHGSP